MFRQHLSLSFSMEVSLPPFKPTRGIRQGDPLLLYLFILCMEYLGFLINESCRKEEWAPLKASKQNLGISHIFFEDDLMLFAKANKAGADSIKKVLSKFCKEFGQLISVEKSRIYFSPNVPPNVRDDICGLLNIAETSCLGKYLSFPLNHRGVGRNRYNFIKGTTIKIAVFYFNLGGWPSWLGSWSQSACIVLN